MGQSDGTVIQKLVDELDQIAGEASSAERLGRDFQKALDDLVSWKDRATIRLQSAVSQEAADEFKNAGNFYAVFSGDFPTLDEEVARHRRVLSKFIGSPIPEVKPKVVFSVHGIKTRGKWQKDVTPLLNQAGFTVVPLDYGYFLALQLLIPSAREKKVDWFREEYIRQCNRLQCSRPSIAAHSLGSYLVAQALEKYPEIKIDRAIFCGAIIRRDFPWKDIAKRGQINGVLNQFGGNDIWARLVAWVVRDAGQSGLRGFSNPTWPVCQQWNPKFRHSDYFYDLNFKDNWIPFLQCGDKRIFLS
jgi:hypothetical protein